MANISLPRFKISLGKKEDSGKIQGLRVGDIALRQYFDNTTQFYSLLLVDEIGTSALGGDYFVGKLLDGDEPGSTGTELLDFVRVTNLFDTDRMGALYMTGSDSHAPYMDVIDALGMESSIFWPTGLDSNNYNSSGVGAQYGLSEYDNIDRKYKLTRNNVVTPVPYSFKPYFHIGNKMIIGKKYILSYKFRSNKAFLAPTFIGDEDSLNINTSFTQQFTTNWQYSSIVFLCNEDPENNYFQSFMGSLLSNNDYIEYSDFSIIPLDSVINRTTDIKSRFGRLDGIIDPNFGSLSGYGAYVKRLYATGDVNIVGTLTAGDANGQGSTFYAGKIAKNLLRNSDTSPLDNRSNVVISTVSELSPTGVIASITKYSPLYTNEAYIKSASTWISQSDISKNLTISMWVKGNIGGDVVIQFGSASINKFINKKTHTITANVWQRISLTAKIDRYDWENYIYLTVVLPKIYGVTDSLNLFGFQLEYGDSVSPYQKTDSVLSTSDDYGLWASRGGFGGTMQNPLLKLNQDGGIKSDEFAINADGSAEFSGKLTIKGVGGLPDSTIDEAMTELANIAKNQAIQVASDDATAKSNNAILTSNTYAANAVSGFSSTLGALAVLDIITDGDIGNKTISAAKLGTSIIDGAYINTGLLDADVVRATIIKTDYIQGLSLNFTRGLIGGWSISDRYLMSGSIQLDSLNGFIRSSVGGDDKWRLNNSGSGQLASGNISWDNNGNVTFGDNVKLNWANSSNGLKFRYIRDYQAGSSSNGGCHWIEIMAMAKTEFDSEINLALGKPVTSNYPLTNGERITDGILNGQQYAGGPSNNQLAYVQIDLGAIYSNIDYIQVYHYWLDGRSYNKTKTQVSIDNITWVTVFDSEISGTWKATELGKRISINDNSKLTKITNTGVYTGDLTAGQIDAAKATILGAVTAGSFNIGNGKFRVTSAGVLSAVDANITGAITATSGAIAGFSIGSQSISKLLTGNRAIRMGVIAGWGGGANIINGFCVGDSNTSIPNNKVMLYQDSQNSSYGISHYGESAYTFQLGSINKIAGWSFTDQSLTKTIGENTITIGMYPGSTQWGGFNIGSDNNNRISIIAKVGEYNLESFIDGKTNFILSNTGNTIAGWTFNNESLYKQNGLKSISLNSVNSTIVVNNGNNICGYFGETWDFTHNIPSGSMGIAFGDKTVGATKEYFRLDNSVKRIAGWTISEDKLQRGFNSDTEKVGLTMSVKNSGSGAVFINSRTIKGFTVTWMQNGNAGHIVMGQVMNTYNTLKAGFYGIQMMDSVNNEYFCLSSRVNIQNSREVYNRIAGWDFTTKMLKVGDGSASNTNIGLIMSTVNSGSGHIYTHNRILKGFSLTWHRPGNAGHIAMGQIAATPSTLKTGFNGIQMMDHLGNEYFCLSADTSIENGANIYNKIAGWSFNDVAIFSGVTPQLNNDFDPNGMTIHRDGAIRAKEFRIDTNGSAFFNGKISVGEGSIAGFTINSGSISSIGNKLIINKSGYINLSASGNTGETSSSLLSPEGIRLFGDGNLFPATSGLRFKSTLFAVCSNNIYEKYPWESHISDCVIGVYGKGINTSTGKSFGGYFEGGGIYASRIVHASYNGGIGAPTPPNQNFEIDVSNIGYVSTLATTSGNKVSLKNAIHGQQVIVFNRDNSFKLYIADSLSSANNNSAEVPGGGCITLIWDENDKYNSSKSGGHWIIVSIFSQNW